MGSEWPEVSLAELYDIRSGLSKPAKDFGSGYPFLAFKEVFNNYFVPEELSELVQSSDKEREGCSIRRGDVFLTRTSETMHELGMSCVALKDYENATFNGFTKRLRPKECTELVPEYVGYYLRSSKFRHSLSAFSTMSTRASLNNQMIEHLKIVVPPVSEQKSIGWILRSFDKKIELNRRMNETLEAMAQALFKSWFIDFDPVIDNALAAGNPIPDELQPRAAIRESLGDARKPLPDHIRNLFPSEFELTEEMGWVPKGWGVGPVSEFAELNPESWSAKNAPTFVRYVDLANTKNGRINIVVPYNFSEAPSRARRVLRQDDTIIGTVRPGNRSFAYIYEDDLTGSTGFAVMRPKEKFFRAFVYLSLTRNEVIEHFAHLADGAAYPAIRPEVVASLSCVLPTSELLEHFDILCQPWMLRIGEREFQSDSLSKLRDTLLPKLFSGEIRITDAEKLVGVAA